MANVTKADLIELIRRKAEKTYTKAEVDDIYTSLCEVIEDEVCNGNMVSLQGVGRFDLTVRAAHSGRNPATGEEIEIPEKVAISFRITKSLKDKAAELNPDDFRKGADEQEAEKPKREKKPEPAKSARRNKR